MTETEKEKKKVQEIKNEKDLLVPLNTYLSSGIHIGMRNRLKIVEKFIYRVRPNRICVFDIEKIDERLRAVAKLLAKYDPSDILVVGRKVNTQKPVAMFANVTGAKAVYGRFLPGTLTNPNQEVYLEPKIIVISDPFADRQALIEAVRANIPIIALCDSFNNPSNVDLIIPCNNKGRRSVALIYWILAREFLKEKGIIKGDAEFTYSIDDFVMPMDGEKK